jgi:hypothetical protein
MINLRAENKEDTQAIVIAFFTPPLPPHHQSTTGFRSLIGGIRRFLDQRAIHYHPQIRLFSIPEVLYEQMGSQLILHPQRTQHT